MSFWSDRRAERDRRVLEAIRSGCRYGYDLHRALKIRSGSLYPSLARLERDGSIVGEFETGPEPRRRAYRPAEGDGAA